MAYVFKGRLCGLICAECREALSEVTIRLYRSRDDQNVTALAVANPKETLKFLSDEEVKAKAGSLLAETKTDADGNFSFTLDEKKQKYGGQAFEVDVYCATVPHRKPSPKSPQPRQFSITTLQPMWRQSEAGFAAAWDYCIPHRFWCHFRSHVRRLDDLRPGDGSATVVQRSAACAYAPSTSTGCRTTIWVRRSPTAAATSASIMRPPISSGPSSRRRSTSSSSAGPTSISGSRR